MKPSSITVVAANSPYLIPLDYRAHSTTVDADVTGTVDYTVSFTVQNIYEITTPATNAHWNGVTNMVAATADQIQVIDGSITCLKVVINSGTGSVAINTSQADSV